MPTSTLPNDYRRSSEERASYLPLPTSADSITPAATRLFRREIGPVLSRSLLSVLVATAAARFLFAYVVPGLFITSNPQNVQGQIEEFILGALLGLIVSIPLIALSLTSLLLTGIEITARALGFRIPNERAAFVPLLRTLLRGLGRGAIPFAIGLAVLVTGGAVSALGPADAGWAAAFVFIGGAGAVIGLIASAMSLPGVLMAGAIQRIEGLSPKDALGRSKALREVSNRLSRPSGYLGSLLVLSSFVLLVVFGLLQSLLSASELQTAMVDAFRFSPMTALLIEEVISLAVFGSVLLIILPYIAIATALTYYERRVTLEGLDIEVLMLLAKRRGQR